MTPRTHPSTARRARFGRWLATALAGALLALWGATLWVWCDVGTDQLGGISVSIAHGCLEIEQTDTTFMWSGGPGGGSGASYPARSWAWGGVDGTHAVYSSVTLLDDLPGYGLTDRWAVLKWLPHAGSIGSLLGPGRRWYLELPLWIPFAGAAAIAALAWRTHLRPRSPAELAACPACGYDLRGLAPSAPCPECGATAASRQPIGIW
ncbi:MAG TPA: hypothetical protein PKE29_13220 [Phycisphaerales bacterium]|nr:hypothetical protein [Phycisphaerales bacterium]